MTSAILFKGEYEVIRMNENREKAKNLYKFISDYFKTKNCTTKMVETNSSHNANQHIGLNTAYLVGHSNGSRRILTELDPYKIKKQIKQIVLFDVGLIFLEDWVGSGVPIIIFLSNLWSKQKKRRYNDHDNIITIDDDHYFNNSFKEIQAAMDIWLGT